MKKISRVINGVEYTALWRGVKFCEDVYEKCRIDGTDIISQTKLSEVVFSQVIISPKIKIDDFESTDAFSQVYEFGKSVIDGTFEKNVGKAKLARQVRENWAMYRLVMSECGFDYNTVFNQMTPQEIRKANIALDMKIEAEKKAIKKKH